jgi:hypothetical protein
MKNIIKITLLLLSGATVLTTNLAAQSPKDVCLKIGGSYFINCKRTIAFGEQAVMTVSGGDKSGRMVNFDIFSPQGMLDASLKDGKFSGANANAYAIKNIGEGFTITDTRSNRIVLKVLNVGNTTEKRNELHVWADFFLPGGGRFQCTPEESNVPVLQMMPGSTFENMETAIQLN